MDRIHLPLRFFRSWIDQCNFRKIRYYLTLLLEVDTHGNHGWRLEELGNLLKHQTPVLKEKLECWEDEGWIQTMHSPKGVTYYYLTPLEEEALAVSKEDLLQLQIEAKSIAVVRWLWLQLHPIQVVSQKELMRIFNLEHQNGLYRMLRELQALDVLEFYKVSIEGVPHCEFEYEEGQILEQAVIVPPIQSSVHEPVTQTIDLPVQLIQWMTEVEDFMASKLYCQWAVYLLEVPNFYLSLNELITNVFSVKHYNIMQRHLAEMRRLQMIEVASKDVKRQRLIFPDGDYVTLELAPLKRALTELKHKEFVLWLSFQLEPTTQISTDDIVSRINCYNGTQARNIFKRLLQTSWVSLLDERGKYRGIRYEQITVSDSQKLEEKNLS